MTALFAGLTTVDVLHGLGHVPNPLVKTTSTDFLLAAGGPATNAAVTYSALSALKEIPKPAGKDRSGELPHLLTAIGSGTLAAIITADLEAAHVQVIDATAPTDQPQAPAISSIIDHPQGRMVTSTNARVPVDAHRARTHLSALNNDIDVVLVDGHNPELADLALRWGTSHFPSAHPQAHETSDNPFAELEEKPSHLRILDGGSWKPWFTPLLGLIDIAVISADFLPPLLQADNPDAIADFLRGFGIQRIIRTNGPDPVQWWWDGNSGTVEVPEVNALSTLGAGDIFHGAFAWATAYAHRRAGVGADPSAFIDFANRVAATSVTHFGTRSWPADPAIARAVADFVRLQGV